MNILLLTPGINKKYNDNYYAYKYITTLGNNLMAISNRENIIKGGGLEYSPEIEIDENLTICRLFKTLKEQNSFFLQKKKYGRIKKIISKFKPDIIFCENRINMPLAIKIKKNFCIPVILRLEFAFSRNDPYKIIGKKKFIKNKFTGDYLGVLMGFLIWKWLCYHSDAVITCYYGDKANIEKLVKKGKPAFYIAWPGKRLIPKGVIKRNKNRGVFIGSFDPHKNIKEFKKTLPEIFEKTPVEEFYIVGDGVDIEVVEDLKKLYPTKIKHIISLSRDKCLQLIASSYFSYSPTIWGGWGFIGDSWAMMTPLVITHNHYGFKDGVDSIVASTDTIADRINKFYDDNSLFEKLSSEGYKRFINNHSAQHIGQQYYNICRKVKNYK